MRPEPVWKRILKALELGAMTGYQLMRCLSLSMRSIEDGLHYLFGLRAISIVGKVKLGKSRPAWLYGLKL